MERPWLRIGIVFVTLLFLMALVLPAEQPVQAQAACVWSLVNSDTSTDLYGVWGSSPSDVYAVGGNYVTGVVHYDGSSWSVDQKEPQNWVGIFYGVWGSSANDFYIVGNLSGGGYISNVLYPGPGSAMISLPSYLYGVWGSSANNVFSVGAGGYILKGEITPMTSGTANDLKGIWGNSASDVFAVGNNGTILHYGGTGNAWSLTNSDTTSNLNGVWGSSATNVYAVGSGGTILHYNGNVWSPMTSNTGSNLNGVWGSSATNVYAVGSGGTILHYDGSNWSVMSSGTTNDLRGVWGSSATNVYAVGFGGTILHYYPPAVTRISPAYGPETGGTSVTITGTNLYGATVQFGSTPATITLSNSDTVIATSPAGSGTVDVTVTTGGGTSATNANDRFTYIPAPTLTRISPASGPGTGGTSITITGTNLFGVTGIKFGSTPATIPLSNSDTVTAMSPAGSGTVDVTVTTGGGTSATNANDRFTYIPAPTRTVYTPVYPPPTTLPLSVNVDGTHFNTVISISGKTLDDITVSSPDNNVTLHIPSGTTLLTSSGTAPAYPTSIIALPDTFAPQPPPGDNIIGIPYSCLPGGLHFNPPLTLTWKLGNLPAGISAADLEVAFYNTTSDTWVAVPSTYDPATGSVVATISHFTDYAVINTAVSTTTTTVTTTTPTTTASVPVTTSTPSTPATTSTSPPATTSTSSPVITSTSTPATTSPPATTSSSVPWGLITGVIAAAAGVVVAAAVVLPGHNRKPPNK